MKNILLFLLILAAGYGAFWSYQKITAFDAEVVSLQELLSSSREKNQKSEQELLRLQQEQQLHQEQNRVHTILAVGDIMLDRGVAARVKKIGEGYDFSFDKIRQTLTQADLVFANLEGSISSVGADTGKKYSFRFEPATALSLKDAGIDVVSLANNHMLDWGRESLCETTHYLNQVEVLYAGAGCNSLEAEAPAIFDLGNTTIAFLAYTEFYKGAHATADRAGMSEFNMTKITERIKNLKTEQGIDVVIVSMHWGEEYKSRSNNFQVTTGHALVDAGADVIIGHHPHVDQEVERYQDAWIIYSLGNFVFDQSWSVETMEAIIADIKVQNKKVIGVTALPITINSDFQPSLKIE